jgi:TonB family protein
MSKLQRYLVPLAMISLVMASANSHAQSRYDQKKAEIQRAAARAAAQREAARREAEKRWRDEQIAEQRAAEAELDRKRQTFFPPTARGFPANWITSDDYPTQAIQGAVTGIVVFRLMVGEDGRPESCDVLESSGSTWLDQYTCTLVMRRARFNPARDGLGTPMRGVYSNRVRFNVPIDNASSAEAPTIGRVPQLGLSTGPVPASLAQFWRIAEYGEWITGIDPGSLADKAGLHNGDIVLMINGQRIEHNASMKIVDIISELNDGSLVRIYVLRPSTQATMRFEVTLEAGRP